MTTLREAAQAALDALDALSAYTDALIDYGSTMSEYQPNADVKLTNDAREALRAALAAEPAQPVAWMHTNAGGFRYFRKKPQDKTFNPQPVYLHPPAPPADVPRLTNEDINSIDRVLDHVPFWRVLEFARAVEAEVRRRMGVVG